MPCSEWHKKKILSINEANDTIEYNQTKLYFFNRKDSGARSEEDVVTVINTGLLVKFLLFYEIVSYNLRVPL